jgi:hypothetical protein
LALVSLLISVVGPSGKRMYTKFSKRVAKIESVGEEHDRQFIRFLEDEHYFELNKSLDINQSEIKI